MCVFIVYMFRVFCLVCLFFVFLLFFIFLFVFVVWVLVLVCFCVLGAWWSVGGEGLLMYRCFYIRGGVWVGCCFVVFVLFLVVWWRVCVSVVYVCMLRGGHVYISMRSLVVFLSLFIYVCVGWCRKV